MLDGFMQKEKWTRLLLKAISLSMILALVMPVSKVFAVGQLTARSVTIGTSKASATNTYTYAFTTPTTTNIGSIMFEACTTPLSTCTSPGGTINMNVGATTLGSGWTSANVFTRNGTGAGTCTAAANVLCTARAVNASETAGARTMTASLQVNPTAVGSYFIRITTFSDTGWTTSVDTGVVAYAVASQLTITARIQEILNFCVGTTSVNDSTTTPGGDCTAISGTTLDLGVLDSSSINISPISTNGGSNTNGVVMVRTNAQSGVVIQYFSEQDTSSGFFKVAGASCSGTSTTDQCINSTTTQAAFSAGTENFGMTIAAVNCVSTTSYTCLFTSGSYNLARNTNYDGTGGNTYGTSGGFAWNDTVTPTTIASSAASSVKVVDDEALILRFAATPSITTPTGAYTVTSTYIATATY